MLKGTFEGLIPLAEGSFANQFAKNYDRILLMFLRNPSHLTSMNYGLEPDSSQTIRQIFDNMFESSSLIADLLRHEAKNLEPNAIGDRSFWRELLFAYAQNFENLSQCRSMYCNQFYDPTNYHHFHTIHSSGNRFSSLWSELRVAMLVPNLSAAALTAQELLDGKILTYLSPGVTENQELDLFWSTGHGSAIGDIKVYDRIFSANHPQKSKVIRQIRNYVRIAAHMRTRTDVYFFFVGGITTQQVKNLQKIADDENRRLMKENAAAKKVQAFILGDYESHPHLSLSNYWKFQKSEVEK